MGKKGLGRRTPKEVIENARDPKRESAFIKWPREEPVDVSGERAEESVKKSSSKFLFERLKHRGSPYMDIHTHKYTGGLNSMLYFPSSEDIKLFLSNRKAKMMVIATRKEKTGEVLGYYILRKTKETPKVTSWISEIDKPGSSAHELAISYLSHSLGLVSSYNYAKKHIDLLDKIKKEYHLQERILPTKGYAAYKGEFYKPNNLEKMAEAAVFVMFFAGLFFLSSNVTGNVIANLNKITMNILGIILFALGIVGLFFYSRRRKQTKEVYFY